MKYAKLFVAIFSLLTINITQGNENSPTVKTQIVSTQKMMREYLATGKTDLARNILEQASGNFHSVEIELGLIQTLMQAGEYQHALSAAAHTQAEHFDLVEPRIFYAWLLAIGGQQNSAQQLLSNALDKNPDNLILHKALIQIKTNQLVASELGAMDNVQLSPFANLFPIGFTYKQSGIILNDGIHVITTTQNLESATQFIIINGLGETSYAFRDTAFIDEKLALFTLEKPIKNSQAITIAKSPSFPGTPIYLIGYSSLDQNQAKWPQLNIDILGMPTDQNIEYPIHIQTNAMGAGVYNTQGNLLGIASWNVNQNNVMIPFNNVRTYLETKTKSTSPTSRAQNTVISANPISMADIYETALKNSVQVLGK